jgi:tetratricopeptide (TPR) repeat protein
MSARRLKLAGVASAVAASALLLGGVLNEAVPESASAVAAPEISIRGGGAAEDTASVVRRFETAVRANPKDGRSFVVLGSAYQQRFRETADATYLSRSEKALKDALRLSASDPDAASGLGALALSRHDFRTALELGRRAVAKAPNTARHHGVVGDALLELGRYDAAFAAFDRMAALRPGLASYSRIAYARELLGRTGGAIEAMQLAADAGGGRGEPTAWAEVELGKLYFGSGRPKLAARHFRTALVFFPGYVYALDALARAEAALGRYELAIKLARRAVDTTPLPQFVATLGDLYRATGRAREAREQYALVGAIERLLQANGVRTDLETALFDVDHGLRVREALERARLAHAERPGIVADDVLAWALVRDGQCAEGLRFAKRALRLGTRDAGIFFHRAMAERCVGHADEARRWFRRALATNTHFSLLWAPVARRYAG